MTADELAAAEITLRGATARIARDPVGGQCEWAERGRGVTQPCSRDGAQFHVVITFATGRTVARHVCTNHALRFADLAKLTSPLS